MTSELSQLSWSSGSTGRARFEGAMTREEELNRSLRKRGKALFRCVPFRQDALDALIASRASRIAEWLGKKGDLGSMTYVSPSSDYTRCLSSSMLLCYTIGSLGSPPYERGSQMVICSSILWLHSGPGNIFRTNDECFCQFHMGFSAAKPPHRPHPNSSLC